MSARLAILGCFVGAAVVAEAPALGKTCPRSSDGNGNGRWTSGIFDASADGSPLDGFRKLLAMGPGERQAALAEKPEGQRSFLAAKLKEYDALGPADRELRLRVTQLRFYLTPLLYKKPEERAARLDAMPAEDRRLVEERLEQWDKLPSALQREVRDNEWFVQNVVGFQSGTPAQQKEMLDAMPADRRSRIERDLARWNGFSPDKRQRMLANFKQFFELNERERARIVKTVPGIERHQVEKTLLAFEKLPAEQRTMCLDALNRLSKMTPDQQLQFFSNADRWAKLSEGERDVLRRLLTQMPPLPPGYGEPATPLPVLTGPKR
ncbi:MAG: DUF3106 domain-containing protein [Verrucomicrobia bacterium]|nr:DUF3106 domain-containing protein [Verrucomicrobiota bacterium]